MFIFLNTSKSKSLNLKIHGMTYTWIWKKKWAFLKAWVRQPEILILTSKSWQHKKVSKEKEDKVKTKHPDPTYREPHLLQTFLT